MLNALRHKRATRRAADLLETTLSNQARLPVFYGKYQVADTIDGRFDLLVLHAWLVLERLGEQKLQGLAQALVNGLFVQFDEALRQQGAGDIGLGRRMNKMADAFYGRLNAYEEAKDGQALAQAIVRNVFRGDASKLEPARMLSIYATATREALNAQDLAQGEVEFGQIS